MDLKLTLLGLPEEVCAECGRRLSGVRFTLSSNPAESAFLCWRHFRRNAALLLKAGLIARAPRRPGDLDPAGVSWSLYSWAESDVEGPPATAARKRKRRGRGNDER